VCYQSLIDAYSAERPPVHASENLLDEAILLFVKIAATLVGVAALLFGLLLVTCFAGM
jgi:hypothetical protein